MPELATENKDSQTQNQTIWDRSPAGRLFSRVFSFELLIVSTLMIIPILLAQGLRNPQVFLHDPDIWWHLANARHLFASGFIHIEPYSFSVAGKPWINPEWLAELPYWLGFSSFGLHGLLVAAIIAAELNVLAIYFLARQRTGHMWSSLLASVLGVLLMTVNMAARTILWGYICLAIELAILEAWKRGHRRLIWLIPPLFTLWINVHGSWAIGALIFLVFATCSHISLSLGDFYSERRSMPELRQVWIVTALCCVAVWINPYGWRLVWNPIDYALHLKLSVSVVQEWQPLHLSSLEGKFVVLMAAIFIVTNGMRRRRWDLFEAFLVTFGLYGAVAHIRFCFLLAILATPSLAFDLRRTWLSGENTNQKRPLLNLAFAAAFWAFAISNVPTGPQLQKAYDQTLPIRLVAQVQPGWRIFNSMSTGGLLAFYGKPEIIDSRYDTFDYNGVLAPFLNAININHTLAILKHFRIDHVLYRQNTPFVYFLMHTGGWKQIGEQSGFVLLARSPK